MYVAYSYNNVKFDDCAKKDKINRLELKFFRIVRNESEKFNGVDKRAVGVMSHVLHKGNGHHIRVN